MKFASRKCHLVWRSEGTDLTIPMNEVMTIDSTSDGSEQANLPRHMVNSTSSNELMNDFFSFNTVSNDSVLIRFER
jgi:hypothetical protein